MGKRLRRLSEILARELEVVQLGTKIQSQVQSEIGQGPARVLPARAAQGDPAGARRGRRAAGRDQRAARAHRAGQPPRGGPQAGGPGARPAGAPAPGGRRVRGDPHLPRVAGRAALGQGDRGRPRHPPRARGARRRPLRPRKVKDRILEYLAVRTLQTKRATSSASRPGVSRSAKGPILCFVGPPGVGKTSLGQSIAKSLGREFERISVGGVRDEAEIRGHRRTYVGAMPGDDYPRAARRRHPQPGVHDRRDRQDGRRLPRRPRERDARGARPGPERQSFRDHYLDLEFDLSEVLFIATANTLDTVPIPLQDRMEVIQLAGYTPTRSSTSPSATWCRARSSRTGWRAARSRSADAGAQGDHRRVHARGGRSQPRARDREHLPQGRPRRSPRER